MAKRRIIIAVAAGFVSAAGAAVIAVNIARHTEEQKLPPDLAAMPGPPEICLMTGVPLVEGADKACYRPDEILALLGDPVVDNQGAPVTLQLTHPIDSARAPETVTTCFAYEDRAGEGWFALTSREMRREAYFVRACGILRLMEQGRPPTYSYFEDGACSSDDISSMAEAAPFALGEGDASPASFEPAGKHQWRIAADQQIANLQELAHADFNGDGRGDIAVFIEIGAVGGTARAYHVGYLDKPGAAGPVRFIERPTKRGP